MKKLIFLLLFLLLCSKHLSAQPIERLINNFPVFVVATDVKAADGILTIGVFSEETQVKKDILKKFEDLKAWDRDLAKKSIGHKKVKAVALNSDNLKAFDGQIIWVMDADKSREQLKSKTEQGFFTIGAQNKAFEDFLFISLTYENKSDNPSIERWRLVRFFANCEISPINFTRNLMAKQNFYGKNCE